MAGNSKYVDFVVNGIRFYTNKNSGDKVMKYVIDNCPDDKFVISQTHDYTRKGETRPKLYCKYGSVDEPELSDLLKDNFQIYDVMQTTAKFPYMRVVVDIDKYDTDPLEESKALLLEKFPGAILNISGSIAQTDKGMKYSYHIVLFNYVVEKVEEYELVQKLCYKYKDDLGFDPSIYRNYGQYKCVNQAKKDGRIQKIISGSADPLDHSLRCNIPTDKKTMSDSILNASDFAPRKRGRPRKCPVEKKPKLMTTPEQEVKLMDIPLPDNFDIYSASPLDKLNAFPNPTRFHPHARSYTLNMMVARWCKHVGISFREFWKWCRQKEDTLDRQEKYKTLYLNLQSEYVRDGFMQTLLILVYGSRILKDKNFDRLKELYNVHHNLMLDKFYLNTDDLKDAFDIGRIVLPKWPMGGGKTTAVLALMAMYIESNPDIRILFVTCRTALTIEQMAKLDKLGFNSYLDMTNEEKHMLNDYKRFACSVQSLQLVQGDYDLIIFDEAETLFGSFSGTAECHITKKEDRVKRHWNTLVDLIRDTPHIIAMDGILSNMTVNLFSDIRPFDVPVVIQSTHKQHARQIRLCKSIETLYDQIHKAIESGKKIFVGMSKKGDRTLDNMDSVEGLKSHLLARYGWTEGVEVRAFHSHAYKEKEKLKKCEDELGHPKVRVWIGNSSIAEGVSYDPTFDEKHQQYDMVFASMDLTCMSNHDFFQLLYRVRKPKETQMFIHLARINPLARQAKMKQIPFQAPTDDIWKNMRALMDLKHATDFQSKNRQTFKFFCTMLNIDITSESMLTLTEEEINQIHLAFDGSTHNMFMWDKIRMLSKEEYDRLLQSAKREVLSVGNSLAIDKYNFRIKFKKEDRAAGFWQAGNERTFIERVHDLMSYQLNDKESIGWISHFHQCSLISRLLMINNLRLGDKEGLENILEGDAVKNLPFSEISKHFNLRITNYRTDVWYKMFYAYFGSDNAIYKDKDTGTLMVGGMWDDYSNELELIDRKDDEDVLQRHGIAEKTVGRQKFFSLIDM